MRKELIRDNTVTANVSDKLNANVIDALNHEEEKAAVAIKDQFITHEIVRQQQQQQDEQQHDQQDQQHIAPFVSENESKFENQEQNQLNEIMASATLISPDLVVVDEAGGDLDIEETVLSGNSEVGGGDVVGGGDERTDLGGVVRAWES